MNSELRNVLRVEDPTGLVYYLGTITPAEIKQLTFVPVVSASEREGQDESILLNERPNEGYQRSGEVKRMQKICEAVQSRPKCLIPPVVIATRGAWKFTAASPKTPNFGTITASDQAAIIDGQHRLGGLLRLLKEAADESVKGRQIPFMAVDELDQQDEREEFMVINDNQKGVKKSLIHYLGKDKDFYGRAAYALMEDDGSPFKGRIDIQKKHDWDLVLFGAVKECVELMFGDAVRTAKKFDPYKDEKIQERAIEYVLSYWKAVRENLPEFWADIEKMPPIGAKKSKEKPGTTAFTYRLLEETGIRAFSELASELFALTWMDLGKPSFEQIGDYLSKMSGSDQLKKVLTKPKHDPTVLELDPKLDSSGKAGVKALSTWLHDELRKVKK